MRDNWQIAAYSAAAFAAGAAAGAYCMKRWCSTHEDKHPVHLNAAVLHALQSPAGELSPTHSIAPSVYSLPGTPRVSANGRHFARSDSVGSAGGAADSRCVYPLSVHSSNAHTSLAFVGGQKTSSTATDCRLLLASQQAATAVCPQHSTAAL